MKQFLFFLLMGLIMVIVFTRCQQKTSNYPGNRLQKIDTTLLYGAYKFDSVPLRFGYVQKVRYDILAPSTKDSMRNEWKKDSFYLIIKMMAVNDSISNDYFKQRGVRITPKDSITGEQNYVPYNFPVDKRLVKTGYLNLDSAVAQLEREKL